MMQAQLQVGEADGIVVIAIHEVTNPAKTQSELGDRRWVCGYATRADACWDIERRGFISPSAVQQLSALPAGQVIVPLPAFVRDVKNMLRGYIFAPVTREQ